MVKAVADRLVVQEGPAVVAGLELLSPPSRVTAELEGRVVKEAMAAGAVAVPEALLAVFTRHQNRVQISVTIAMD